MDSRQSSEGKRGGPCYLPTQCYIDTHNIMLPLVMLSRISWRYVGGSMAVRSYIYRLQCNFPEVKFDLSHWLWPSAVTKREITLFGIIKVMSDGKYRYSLAYRYFVSKSFTAYYHMPVMREEWKEYRIPTKNDVRRCLAQIAPGGPFSTWIYLNPSMDY